MVEQLLPGDLRVWYRCTEALSPADVTVLARILSSEERARAARFAQWDDQRDYVAAHALLRQTLSLYGRHLPAAWQFAATEHGKPHIAEANPTALAFSLSHTRGLVACAVAVVAEVGVDVEPLTESPERRDLVTPHFSPAEQRSLAALPPVLRAPRFTELWTLKESYLKALGLGLRHPMEAFTIAFDAERDVRLGETSESDQSGWHFALAAPAPAYRLAAAVRWIPAPGRYCVTVRDADAADAAPLPLTRQSPARG